MWGRFLASSNIKPPDFFKRAIQNRSAWNGGSASPHSLGTKSNIFFFIWTTAADKSIFVSGRVVEMFNYKTYILKLFTTTTFFEYYFYFISFDVWKKIRFINFFGCIICENILETSVIGKSIQSPTFCVAALYGEPEDFAIKKKKCFSRCLKSGQFPAVTKE